MNNNMTDESTVTHLKNSAYELCDNIQNVANKAGHKVRSAYNTASHEISHAGEVVTDEIRTNPVRSSIIALGLGMVLGALVRR